MTNPDNTVGTNAGYDGRTTPNAFNDILGAFTRGIVSGWACTPKTGMTVQLGGNGFTRDVAIAEDNAGNKTTINNRTATPVEITLAGAPATGNRIDSIVAYVDSAQSGQGATDVDFPSITFYVILANITVGQGVTTIGSGVISAGTKSQPQNITIADGAITSGKIADGAITSGKIADGAITSGKINWNSIPSYQGIWSGSNPLGAGWTSELTVNIATPGTYALVGNVRTANRKGSNTGYQSRIAVNGAPVMSAYGRWWGAAGEVHDMPCYGVATYTTAGTATVQAITDDTYQENCVELATLIAIRIA